jgi:uncharacterized protein involved in exopolysaccharide biosynthesis
VRPNTPLNLFIGTVLGALLGLAAGIGTAGIHFFNGRNPPPSPASQPA